MQNEWETSESPRSPRNKKIRNIQAEQAGQHRHVVCRSQIPASREYCVTDSILHFSFSSNH